MKALISDIAVIHQHIIDKDHTIFLNISDDILNDEFQILDMMTKFPRVSQKLYAFIPEYLRANEDILKLALPNIARNIELKVLPDEIQKNPQYMKKVVRFNLLAYDYLEESLRKNVNFNISCLDINCFLDVKIPTSVWHNYAFIEAAAKTEDDYKKFQHIAMNRIKDDEIKDYIKALFEQTDSGAEFCALILSKKLELTLDNKQHIKKIKI